MKERSHQDLHPVFRWEGLELTDDRPRQAFERMEPVFGRLPRQQLLALSLSASEAVPTVASAVPRILRLRPLLVQLPTFDMERVDTLEDCALAVVHAHNTCLTARKPVENVAELVRAQREVFSQLQWQAIALAKRGLLVGQPCKQRRGGVSYRDLAFNVIELTRVLSNSGKTQGNIVVARAELDRAELDRAEQGANRLLTALKHRPKGRPRAAKFALAYRQAFTLMVRNYTDVRLAVHFLRRAEGDGELIAPSLFASRGNRKRETFSSQPPKGSGRGASK